MSQAQHAFHPLKISSVERDTADALRVRFDVPPALQEAFRFRPGQHLTLRQILDGEDVRRNYSICSGPGAGYLSITVKRVLGGRFSNHVNDAFRPGATVEVMPPSGRFALPAPSEAPRTYLAIAAGSGITPIISMIRHAMVEEPGSHFILVYGNRRQGSILFAEPLQDLKDRYTDRLVIVHVLSQGGEADVPLLTGRIDGPKLEALVPKLVDVATVDGAFLCGPDTLIKTSMKTLQGLGLAREKIHFEFFARGPVDDRKGIRSTIRVDGVRPTDRTPVESGPELTVTLDGARYTVRMQPDESILEAAIRAGANAPYSCKGGMCCTCRAKLVSGEATMDQNFSLEDWEIKSGFVLTCQAKPSSASVAVDYDQV